MDEAIEFIRTYIQKEYEAALALYGERDDAVFRQKRDEALRYLDPSERVEIGLTRPDPADKRWFRDSRDALGMTVPRPLFKVARYEDPTLGELFRAYVGARLRYPTLGYSETYYLARTAEGLRIVAKDWVCTSCGGASAGGRGACSDCDSTGFGDLSGARLPTLGQPVEVRKLQAPTDPGSLAEYEKG